MTQLQNETQTRETTCGPSFLKSSPVYTHPHTHTHTPSCIRFWEWDKRHYLKPTSCQPKKSVQPEKFILK